MTAPRITPYGRRLTEAEAEIVIRSPHLQWPADIADEARDWRREELRRGFDGDRPAAPEPEPELTFRRALSTLLIAVSPVIAVTLWLLVS